MAGTTLHSVEHGAGEPKVFVNGSAGANRGWLGHLPLVAEGYRAVASSQRSHHPYPWPGNPVACLPEFHAADLAVTIEAIGGGRSRSSVTPVGR
ncbi:MAG: hypothetical protein U0075_13425 [Thermomicrobiales bacterium]